MITREKFKNAVDFTADMFAKTGIVVTPEELSRIEVADFGLGMLDEVGLQLLVYVNTEAQAALHPSLVSKTAREIFKIAEKYGAVGWKVNGAGGDGGSVTLLSGPDKNKRREMLAEINAMGDGVRQIGIRLNESGLRIIRD